MQTFQFGEKHPTTTRRGEAVWIGDYGLHLQCPWRILGPHGIVTGSADLYYPVGDPNNAPPDFRWDVDGANRRDQRIESLLVSHQDDPLQVNEVITDVYGGAILVLTNDYRLEFSPFDSLPFEHWRLLDNIADGRPHYVLSGDGIDKIDDSDI
jgi:hypothetical protein